MAAGVELAAAIVEEEEGVVVVMIMMHLVTRCHISLCMGSGHVDNPVDLQV